MSYISMNEEMVNAGPATVAEPDLERGIGPASVRPAGASKPRTPLNLAEADANEIIEARLYLAAMTHFFSDFSGDGHGDDADA